ncbi:unnamed protein product, partial [Anisakis simplex]|uniref:Uncharacterized protein n=1 Tax=Anisakis simplex TaxID=6269 RepID=A0A0M3JNL2_ANISI
MEEKLSRFIEENAPLSGTLTSSSVELPPPTTSSSRPQSPGGGAIAKGGGASTQNSSLNMSTSSTVSRRSVLVPGSGQPGIDPALLRLIAD